MYLALEKIQNYGCIIPSAASTSAEGKTIHCLSKRRAWEKEGLRGATNKGFLCVLKISNVGLFPPLKSNKIILDKIRCFLIRPSAKKLLKTWLGPVREKNCILGMSPSGVLYARLTQVSSFPAHHTEQQR